jgi:thiol:disulfide interchange protein
MEPTEPPVSRGDVDAHADAGADAAVPGAGDAPRPAPRRSGSQRRLPAVLLWAAAAAAVLRLWTFVAEHRATGGDHGAGLVEWKSGDIALAASARERKPVLYDFTAAWCPPCKRLDSEGWSDATLARMVSRRFVPARIVDRQREDGSNPAWIQELQKRYSVGVLPTVVVADSTGREIAKMEGYRDRKSLDEFLEGALRKVR